MTQCVCPANRIITAAETDDNTREAFETLDNSRTGFLNENDLVAVLEKYYSPASNSPRARTMTLKTMQANARSEQVRLTFCEVCCSSAPTRPSLTTLSFLPSGKQVEERSVGSRCALTRKP